MELDTAMLMEETQESDPRYSLLARVGTVYPYDDGLFGFKWQLTGELGGDCVPTTPGEGTYDFHVIPTTAGLSEQWALEEEVDGALVVLLGVLVVQGLLQALQHLLEVLESL